MTDFKMVPVAYIKPDPNQPRRIYDEAAMQELTASIKEKGVLQPILVRTWACDTPEQTYLLVCGERRFRATQASGLNEIPAVIRNLSDEEALELQIIENLQRKDVHPMEEAVAFRSLREKFSVDDIAIKVGKSPVFVAQRIKLNDLIQDFQEMLFQHKLTLKDAIALCRQPEEHQKVVLKEVTEYTKNWRDKKDWKADRVQSYLERQMQTLDKAPFKTNDKDLYPEMGACSTCSFNTANSPSLFPDLGKKRFCNKPSCFAIKSQRAYQNKIKELITDPDIVFISCAGYLGKEEQQKVKAIEEMGVKVFKDGEFEVIEKPEPVEPWEEFIKSWSLTEEDEEELAAAKDEYADEKAQYESQLKEYNEVISQGGSKKAFVVTGSWRAKEGTIVEIRFKAPKGAKASVGAATGNTEALLIEQEIAAAQDREKRSKELDGEKIHAKVQELLPQCTDYTKNIQELNQEEITAMVFAMAESASYTFRDQVRKLWEVEVGYGSGPKDYNKISRLTHLGLNELMRLFIIDKLKVQNASHLNSAKALAIHNIARAYMPNKVDAIEKEQNEKAEKRQANLKKRLDPLKAKLKDLAPAKAEEGKKKKAKTPAE